MLTRITRIGTSLGVILPRHIAAEGQFAKGTPINIDFEGEKITISKVSRVREGWGEMFAAYAREGEEPLALPDFLDKEALDLE